MICIVCPNGCRLRVSDDGKRVEGARCPRGVTYAQRELTAPMRMLTSTVRLESASLHRLPVKTSREIPKELLRPVMRILQGVNARAPVRIGDILVHDVLGTGADILATREVLS